MTDSFMCPNCGASLKVPRVGATVTCDFCGNTVVVPESLRPKVAPQINISAQKPDVNIGPMVAGTAASVLPGLIITLVVGCLILAGVGAAVFFVMGSESSSPVEQEGQPGSAPVAIPQSATQESQPTGFASLVTSYGEEGTGSGRFDDVRHVAVDGEGNIYTGEYTSGRVQVFDPDGQFLTQWFVENETPLRALAVSRDGTVFAVFEGFIHRFDGMSGEPLGEVSAAQGRGFDDVIVTPDGGLVTAWYLNRDDIVVFDANLQPTLTITAAFESQGEPELDTKVAVDGQGNIYALGAFHSEVFKFDRDGTFLDRWGGDGDQPGQFRAVDDIAVDGQGRVYVSDIFGVQVFDGSGRYIDRFETDGVAFGMVFDPADRLYVAAHDKVLIYEING